MSQRGNILVVLAPSADTVAGSFESFAESEQLVPFMRDAQLDLHGRPDHDRIRCHSRSRCFFVWEARGCVML